MNCERCQRRLLRAESAKQPPADVEVHLRGCGACREWQRRLVQLEANVVRLPVPASQAKGELLARLQNAPAATPRPVVAPTRWPWGWVVGGVAAASVILTCGILLGNAVWQALQDSPDQDNRAEVRSDDSQRTAPAPRKAAGDTLVARVMACDLRLARATSAHERVEALADLADSLQGESSLLVQADGARELQQLARLYSKVVREAVVPRSRSIPHAERRRVLTPIVARLARARAHAERLAEQAPASARALRVMAAAAREGELQLQRLLGKDT